jgi:hypothetical protein
MPYKKRLITLDTFRIQHLFSMRYFLIISLVIYLFIRPVWYFTKLARWGKGLICPDFKVMNEEVNHFKSSYNEKGFFSYNRLGGKIKYYGFLIYFVLFVSFVLLVFFGFIYAYFKN